MKADIPFSRDLVLVGGGHTHALVLKMWAMNPLPGARLTLINPGPLAPYSGMLPGFIAGHYDRDDLYIDLMRLARAAGARLVLGKAHAIDRQRQLVHVRGRPPIGYDLCSIDIGITSSMPDLSGFAEHGVPAKPLDGFAARWEQFCSAPGQGDVAVLGAGVAGAEIAMAAAHRMGKLGREARVHLIDRSGALSRLSRRSRDRVIAALRGLGVVLREHAPVQQVTETSVVLASGEVIDAQITLGAAGTRAHGWLGDLGLPITNGFLDVTPSLQSPEDPAIFAAGDCAHLHHAPRPKAGVFAVREAPVLAHNLRAALMGAPLRSYHPQKDYLKLISLGGKAALAEKSGVAFSGALMWRWKDQIDRKFMRQFGDLEPMQAAPPEERAAGASQEADMLCAGCGSKVGRGVLSGVLEDAPGARADIVPLPGDDAALIRLGEARQVISTDHLRAFTDDPVVMTRIAAVHALGDIWSMGAEPQAALISLILPRMEADLQERSLAEVMAAARQVMGDAGADIIGGHTTMGAEFTLGFTVTGLVGDAPITLGGAQPGDRLILTKPIGTGVLLAAEMQMRASGAHVAAALATMQRPLAKDAGILADAHAMTDVTGFGLAGHLANICRASGVSARLNVDAVPLLAGALELSAAGVQSSLYADNLSDALTMMQAPTTERGRLMLDPQTAGGLLAAVSENAAEGCMRKLQDAGIEAAQIGEIIDGRPQLELIEPSCDTAGEL